MQASSTATRSGHRTATAFEQYVSARRGFVEGAVFFLESGTHLEAVLSGSRAGDVVFTPAGTAVRSDPRVVEYDGRFCRPGDQLTLDGRQTLELQEYVAVPFVSIVGPTVLRQCSADGVAAFFSDADTARESGVFVEQLLSSAVLIDSLVSFVGTDHEPDALVRVHVSADGEYRDGPDGLVIGEVGDERADVEARAVDGAGRGRAFARIVDRGMFEADLDDRRWLARYVAALEILRQWDGIPARPAISGFGGHLVRALDELPALLGVVSADAPFLLTGGDDEYLLVDPVTRRRFRLGIDAARAAECLIATGDESAAVSLLAAELDRRASSVAPVVREVRGDLAAAGLDVAASRDEGL